MPLFGFIEFALNLEANLSGLAILRCFQKIGFWLQDYMCFVAKEIFDLLLDAAVCGLELGLCLAPHLESGSQGPWSFYCLFSSLLVLPCAIL